MSYSHIDYMNEIKDIYIKTDHKIKYKKQVRALKSYTCEMCYDEIPKGDLYFIYKPLPKYNKFSKVKTYFKWRKRCLCCEPMYISELIEIESKIRRN